MIIAEASVAILRRQAVLFKGRTVGHVRKDGSYLIVNRKRTRSGRYDDNFYPIQDVLAYLEGKGGEDAEAFALVMCDAPIITLRGRVTLNPEATVVQTKAGAVTVLPASATNHDAFVEVKRDVGRPAAVAAVNDRPSRAYVDKTKF